MLHPPDCNGTAHHLAECYHGDLPQPTRYYDDQEEEEEVEEVRVFSLWTCKKCIDVFIKFFKIGRASCRERV